MEEIKVKKETVTYAQFYWGDFETGLNQFGGNQVVEDRDPEKLNLDPRVVSFSYGDRYFLTDEQGIGYVPNNHRYYNTSPNIYLGKAVNPSEALGLFGQGSRQQEEIEACIKDNVQRIAIYNGFISNMGENDMTIEEYSNSYSSQSKK
jgi:hypothetical protein